MKKVFYKGRFILIPLAAAAFLSVVSFAVMTLWNCLIPGIFGFSVITFWQAMGLFVLSKLLFGFGRGGGRGCGPCGGGRAPWMRWKMKERLANMSPEERDAFKQKMKERCGGHHPFAQKWNDWADDAKKADE